MNSGNPYDGRYHNQFTYNANGGMLSALAKNAMGETIDNQTYNRATVGGRYVNNRTYAITDVATQTSGEDLLDQQAFDNVVLSNNNYDFTEIGERNKNLSEDIESITWTVYGKKSGVKRTATSGKNNVTFNYDPQNNRIAKHVYTSDDVWINSEYYVHDAQGNLMATYRLEASSGSGLSYELTERHIYGSNSIGINTTPVEMIGANTPTDTYPHIIGDKRFNGSNHLNNVLSVFTDKKLPLDIDNNGIIDGYLPQVISANDYAPFGSRLAERTFNKELYPNSFNGKRESAELDGEQDYGERDYNPKEREFDNFDKLSSDYPWNSPYTFAENRVIQGIDLDGREFLDIKVLNNMIALGEQAMKVSDDKTLATSVFTLKVVRGMHNTGTVEGVVTSTFEQFVQIYKDAESVSRGSMTIQDYAAKYGGGNQDAKMVEGMLGTFYDAVANQDPDAIGESLGIVITFFALKNVGKGKVATEAVESAAEVKLKVTKVGKTKTGEIRIKATQGEKRLDITKERVKEYAPESRNPGTGERQVNFKKEGLPKGSKMHPKGDPTKRTPTPREIKLINRNTPKK